MIGNGTRDFQPRQGVDYAISPKSAQFARLTASVSRIFRAAIVLDTCPLRLTIAGKSQGNRMPDMKVSLHVQWLGPDHLAVGVGGDLVDPCFRLPQQFLASPLQGFAALVDRD